MWRCSLEPDLIVVFAGINDLRAATRGHDYLHFPTPARQPWKLLATQSQLGRLAYYLATMQRPDRAPPESAPLATSYRLGTELQRAAPAASGDPVVNVDADANNLRTIAGVVRGHGLSLVFMTQQTTWSSDVDPAAKDWHWLLRVDDVRYSEQSMHAALERLNDAMREVAASTGATLYDLAKRMPKTSQYFYDDVHFNTEGARVAGNELAETILAHLRDAPRL